MFFTTAQDWSTHSRYIVELSDHNPTIQQGNENMASVSRVSTATKPLLSQSSAEARRRVLNLYRAWYREVTWSSFCLIKTVY